MHGVVLDWSLRTTSLACQCAMLQQSTPYPVMALSSASVCFRPDEVTAISNYGRNPPSTMEHVSLSSIHFNRCTQSGQTDPPGSSVQSLTTPVGRKIAPPAQFTDYKSVRSNVARLQMWLAVQCLTGPPSNQNSSSIQSSTQNGRNPDQHGLLERQNRTAIYGPTPLDGDDSC